MLASIRPAAHASSLALAATVLLAPLGHAQDAAIAFLKGGRLCVMNSSGGAQTQLTSFKVGRPAFSPDGTKLAFEAAAGAPSGNGIYVMNVDGANLHRIVPRTTTELLFGVDWARTPDGIERIAFVDRLSSQAPSTLYVTDELGLDVIELAFQSNDYTPSFSRTGEFLYSSRDTDLVQLRLGVVGGRLAITQTSSLVYDWPESPLFDIPVLSVSASKTSDRVAIDAWDLLGAGQMDVWIVDPEDPIHPVNLTASFSEGCTAPTWSSDDAWIAFSTKISTRVTIAKVPSAGGAVTNLSNNTSKQTAHTKPAWRR